MVKRLMVSVLLRTSVNPRPAGPVHPWAQPSCIQALDTVGVGRAKLWLLGGRQAGERDTCDWSYRPVDYSEWLQCLFVRLHGSGRASALRALLDPR